MKEPSPSLRALTLASREQEDDEVVRPLEWGLLRRLWTYTRHVRRKRNVLVVLTAIRAIQLPGLVVAMAAIINGPIKAGDSRLLFLAILGYVALAFSADFLFHFRQRYALELGEAVVNALRLDIFRHMQSMPMGFFHRTKVGRIISRVTSDVEAVRVGIQDVLFVSVIQGGQMVFAACVMAYRDWRMFLVVLGMAPVLWALNNYFRRKVSHYSRASQESFSRVTATLAESVNGMRVTQGFGRQETNLGLFRGLLSDHSRFSVQLARTSAILTPLLELNSQFFIAVLLLLGGWRAFHHTMPVGDLITFFLLANQFFAPLAIIGNQYNQALVSMAGAERVFKLLDAKPDWEDDPAATPLIDPRTRGPVAKFGARVEFRKLGFGYSEKTSVLSEIDLVAEPGQTIALVGHTGSGKTSLANLVAKFYLPTAGELLIDGREIRTIASQSLHRQMGIVTQHNFLFTGTVLENLRLGRPEASEAEVVAALEKLGCREQFEALPQGLHSEVGEKGGSLSVGQRQLACFARALVADPRLLIFDEATSAVDSFTEMRLQRALSTLLAGRTSFVIAHRLSTIRTADLIVVLDHGRIVERGKHAELVAANGRYAALHREFLRGASAA